MDWTKNGSMGWEHGIATAWECKLGHDPYDAQCYIKGKRESANAYQELTLAKRTDGNVLKQK
jgi:hypothetical protein